MSANEGEQHYNVGRFANQLMASIDHGEEEFLSMLDEAYDMDPEMRVDLAGVLQDSMIRSFFGTRGVVTQKRMRGIYNGRAKKLEDKRALGLEETPKLAKIEQRYKNLWCVGALCRFIYDAFTEPVSGEYAAELEYEISPFVFHYFNETSKIKDEETANRIETHLRIVSYAMARQVGRDSDSPVFPDHRVEARPANGAWRF